MPITLIATISHTKPTNPDNLDYDRLEVFTTRENLDLFIKSNPHLYILDITNILDPDPLT